MLRLWGRTSSSTIGKTAVKRHWYAISLTYLSNYIAHSYCKESAIISALDEHKQVTAHAFDAVSTGNTTLILARAIAKSSPDGKGKVTYVLGLTPEQAAELPEGVTAERTSVGTAYGADQECTEM